MEHQRSSFSPAGSRSVTPRSPSPESFTSTLHNNSNISFSGDDYPSLTTRRTTPAHKTMKDYESYGDDGSVARRDDSTSVLLPAESQDSSPTLSSGSGKNYVGDNSGGGGGGALRTSTVLLRILAIVILISLFSWLYLEALAGGDIEWVKNHLSSLGVHLTLSILCLTLALSLIVIWQIPRPFAISLAVGMAVILYALKRWDDGESFEMHGAYNMLVFLVVAVPLNLLIQSIICCHRKMSPTRFRRFISMSVIGTMVLTTMFLLYFHSIWGNGANGARLLYGQVPVIGASEHSRLLCEWDGYNIPICTGKSFKSSGGSPTYDLLPDTKSWPAEEKIIHTYNKKIFERVEHKTYTEPVIVNSPSIEAIVASCGAEESKLLLRVVRQESVLERVEAVAKAQMETRQSTEMDGRQKMVDTTHGQEPGQDDATPQNRKPNVLVLFMDAVARRQFYRKLAKSASTIERLDQTAKGGPQLHEFFRYHSVGFNTDDNSRAIYTNHTKEQDPAVMPIWKDFHEAGYITSRVEDNCEDWSAQYTGVATSKYFDHELQSPFCLPPYYALEGNPFGNFNGPYSITPRCQHGENVHWHAFEYMNQFRRAYKDTPWFQMGSLIEGHEGTGEVLLTLDDDLAEFMEGLEKDGSLENTIVFMLADHGLHMGINFMFTPNGRSEHMNPYLSVILPPLVTKKYPSLARGLKHNQQSLITGHEIYSSMKLLASGDMPENGDEDEVDGGAWRRGTLFDEELNPARTCEEAMVPDEYCHCHTPSS
ncbi:hypothetical protein BGW38_000749 [Lunasporangiospora selenospora]|uniref:DUF229-domain-containing protein n=1 Tax=Lunasporangiospora selenospora TaxID=979761 RepID=A0A9P6FUF1_9FUNG|nr:hypothetical protein BGW38_000749 [Lunasporangiospora selenospora]